MPAVLGQLIRNDTHLTNASQSTFKSQTNHLKAHSISAVPVAIWLPPVIGPVRKVLITLDLAQAEHEIYQARLNS
jgi:hypothetical protein